MARISELHYSNAYAESSGVAEFVEVALSPGEDPADFTIGFYSAKGEQGLAIRLDDPGVRQVYDSDTDEYVYVLSAETFPFALTEPIGGKGNFSAVSLVDTSPGGEVIDFYDIGRGPTEIVAQDGVAEGATSENIPTPTNPQKATYSLQFNKNSPDEVTYASVDPGSTGAICFCPGTRILTPAGWRPVEALRPGDRVLTRDSGAQQITWIGRSEACGIGPLAPIEVRRGVLCAERPLRVSPQHRLLLTGGRLEILTGEAEALCSALHLVDGRAIQRVPVPRVTYIHLMCARHEVIWADGVATESFYLGPGSIGAMPPMMRAEFEALFPGLIAGALDARAFGPLARYGMNRTEAAILTSGARPVSV